MVKAVKIVGVRKYSFKGENGNDIGMISLSCLYKDKFTDGTACIVFNVSEKCYTYNNIKVNSNYEIAYTIVNNRNKVVAVFPIDEDK